MAEQKFDTIGFILAYEGGDVTDEQVIEGFQHLINTGMAWTLQGHYGRTAKMLIDEGYCTRKERIVKCSLCDDMWHTTASVGEQEGCTDCDDVFTIQEEDIVTQEEYEQAIKAALDPQEIEFEEAKRNESK